jgi:hypothetical protein
MAFPTGLEGGEIGDKGRDQQHFEVS